MGKRQRKNFLSPLENEVIGELWNGGAFTVRQIYGRLHVKRHKIALTSIAVVLDRLYDQGIVSRRTETCRGGLRYVYRARKNQKEVYKIFLDKTVNKLLERFGPTAASYFHERFGRVHK